MSILQNQTDENWLDPTQPYELGTGLFVIANPQSNQHNAVTGVVIKDIEYRDCVTRGAMAVAFKWIPHRIAPFTIITAGTCSGKSCVYTCANYRCLCINHVCTDVIP